MFLGWFFTAFFNILRQNVQIGVHGESIPHYYTDVISTKITQIFYKKKNKG